MRNDTYPGALVHDSGFSHRLGVLELIHVTLQLLHILLQLLSFPQFISQDIYKMSEMAMLGSSTLRREVE